MFVFLIKKYNCLDISLLYNSHYTHTQRKIKVPPGTENGSSERCHRRTISGSTENLLNQGSLKNHFLKEFFKEPIKVSQRTLKKWFFKEPFP